MHRRLADFVAGYETGLTVFNLADPASLDWGVPDASSAQRQVIDR